jgi:hypothetical protein
LTNWGPVRCLRNLFRGARSKLSPDDANVATWDWVLVPELSNWTPHYTAPSTSTSTRFPAGFLTITVYTQIACHTHPHTSQSRPLPYPKQQQAIAITNLAIMRCGTPYHCPLCVYGLRQLWYVYIRVNGQRPT